MKADYGKGQLEYGPGVEIKLTGVEVVRAIEAYLVAHSIYIDGPRTFTVNDKLINKARVYVDPTGFVVRDGEKLSGRGATIKGTGRETRQAQKE